MFPPLPPELVRRAVGLRSLAEAGVSRAETSGPLWRSPYRGVRLWAAHDLAQPATRIGATLPLLPPDGVLGGWAAAYAAGVWQLDGFAVDGSPLPVEHVLPPPRRLRRRDGIRLRREVLAPTDIAVFRGLRVTSPARTAMDLARLAPDLVEAVVALDAVLHASYVARQDVEACVRAHPNLRGIGQARAALELCDARAESGWETRLRMIWVLEARLPPPHVNVSVTSKAGRFLGRPDLLDEEAGLAAEYDGGHHRELKQHTEDNRREERLERAGLRVIRFTVIDVLDQLAAAQRLREERAARLGRDRFRERWIIDPRDRGASG